MTAWQSILNFICACDSGFLDTVTPVPAEEIAEVERRFGIELPPAYVDMLKTLGGDGCGYQPFSMTHDHVFYELRDYAPPPCVPATDYFRIALDLNLDATFEYEDIYLDLKRFAGDDTPLVKIYRSKSFDAEEDLRDMDRTLIEELSLNAVEKYRHFPQKHLECLTLPESLSVEQVQPLHTRAVKCLRKKGLVTLVDPLRRLVCLGDDQLVAIVRLDQCSDLESEIEALLYVELGGNDHDAVRRTMEQLIDELPDAKLERDVDYARMMSEREPK